MAFFVFVIFWYSPSFTGTSIPDASNGFGAVKVDEVSYVKKLLQDNKIGPEIEYAARTIRYVPDARERKSVSDVDQNLFPDSFTNITIGMRTKLPAGRLLDVHVKQSPRPDQVDASELLFAASTTYDRFSKDETSPMKEWVRWLTDGHGHTNGAGLILALFEATPEQLESVSQTLTTAGINSTVVASNPNLDMPGRYVDLVQMMYNHPTRPARKYLTLIDDDTFFPCLNEFKKTISNYDPNKPFYIGTFTERGDWLINNAAPFAYGGGGIVLTAPAAQKIVSLPCLAKNETTGNYILGADQGDRLLYNCFRKLSEITLTYLPLLHQEDQFGDAAGFYESGQQPLSLHHYKSWHKHKPDRMHIVADACGESCVLQRFKFKDDFVISNGYSVAHYPKGIDFDLLQMEATFNWGNVEPDEKEEVVFNAFFGSLRKSLNGTGRKKGWELLDARKEGDGRVKQVYLKRHSDDRWLGPNEDMPDRDSVVVLTWIP